MFSQNGSNGQQTRPADVARDHHDLAVPTVDERTAERREHEAGQHARDHHEPDRGRRVRHSARDREDRDQADPVAETRDELRTEEREGSRAPRTRATAPAESRRGPGPAV